MSQYPTPGGEVLVEANSAGAEQVAQIDFVDGNNTTAAVTYAGGTAQVTINAATDSGDVVGPGAPTVANRICTYGDTTGLLLSKACTITASADTFTPNTGTLSVSGGNLNVQSASVGSPLTIQIYNTDNTSGASDAHLKTQVGGSSGGDPHTLCTVLGAQSWASGIDNSDGDAYVISASAQPGNTNGLRIATNLSITGYGNFATTGSGAFTLSASGAFNQLSVANTNAAANSGAFLQASSVNGSVYTLYTSGATNWTTGVDVNDSNTFKISQSSSISLNTAIGITTTLNVVITNKLTMLPGGGIVLPVGNGSTGMTGIATLNGSGVVTVSSSDCDTNTIPTAGGVTATGAIRVVNNNNGTFTITSLLGATDAATTVWWVLINPNT